MCNFDNPFNKELKNFVNALQGYFKRIYSWTYLSQHSYMYTNEFKSALLPKFNIFTTFSYPNKSYSIIWFNFGSWESRMCIQASACMYTKPYIFTKLNDFRLIQLTAMDVLVIIIFWTQIVLFLVWIDFIKFQLTKVSISNWHHCLKLAVEKGSQHQEPLLQMELLIPSFDLLRLVFHEICRTLLFVFFFLPRCPLLNFSFIARCFGWAVTYKIKWQDQP